MKHFIVTCDDCGLSEGINLATLDLHHKGIATAASVMTNLPATNHAFRLFSRYSTLETGVHLNLTEGLPLLALPAAAPLTTPNGHFFSRQALFTRALLPTRAFLAAAEAEMRAQIAVFYQYGVPPRHLTTHLHFHAVPSLRKIVLRLARAYHIPWVRTYSLSAGVLPQNPFYTKRAAQPRETLLHDHLIGMKWWVGHQPQNLLTVLTELQGAVEFVIHPCTPRDQTYPSGVRYQPHERHTEMRYFENLHPMLTCQ